MAGAVQPHSLAVTTHAFLIEDGQVHLTQYQHILTFRRGITHHCLIFLFGATVITFAVAPISTKRIAFHIHWLVRPFSSGDIDNDYFLALDFLDEHIL